MNKAALSISIVALCISALTLAAAILSVLAPKKYV